MYGIRLNTKEKRLEARKFYFREGMTIIDMPDIELQAYVGDNPPVLAVFTGTSSKPCIYTRYRSAERRDEALQEAIENQKKVLEYKAQQKEKNKGSLTDSAATAKAIRERLKKEFPGVKFSVKAKTFSMGDSVDIYWTDGPRTQDVDAITRQYQKGYFDGMTDCYEYRPIDPALGCPGAKFVHCHRAITPEYAQALIQKWEEAKGCQYNRQDIYGRKKTAHGIVFEIEQDYPELMPYQKPIPSVAEKKGVEARELVPSVSEPAQSEQVQEFSASPSEIPLDLAIRAHEGTSFIPEKRGEQEQQEYYNHLMGLYNEFKAQIKPEQLPQLVEEMNRYKMAYRTKYIALLHARSAIISPMIAGPSKFPVTQNEKRNNAYDKKLQEFIKWQGRAKKAITQNLGLIKPKAVSGDDPDAIAKLKAKLKNLEQLQERMKQANKIVRSSLPDTEKVVQIIALGFKEKQAQKLLEPDFAGRIGFPDYALTNNNAEIRRIKTRIESLSKQKEEIGQVLEFEGGKIVDNPEVNRVQIFFDSKPSEAIRNQLKAHGFKWAPSIGVWQRFRSQEALHWAQKIAGGEE